MKEPIEPLDLEKLNKDQLSPEDKKRIAEAADKAVRIAYEIDYPYEATWEEGYKFGAEYATKYEREQASTMEDISKRRIEYLHEQLTAQAERIKELETELHALNEAVKHGI